MCICFSNAEPSQYAIRHYTFVYTCVFVDQWNTFCSTCIWHSIFCKEWTCAKYEWKLSSICITLPSIWSRHSGRLNDDSYITEMVLSWKSCYMFCIFRYFYFCKSSLPCGSIFFYYVYIVVIKIVVYLKVEDKNIC